MNRTGFLLPLLCISSLLCFGKSLSVRPGITHFHRTAVGLSHFPVLVLRGGTQLEAMPNPIPFLISSFESGPYGVVTLTAIAACICVPATQYKNQYGISVGYGLSVAAIALSLRKVFSFMPRAVGDVLTGAAIFYGLRLAIYLFVRDVSGEITTSTMSEPARLKRIPFAISLALFYAFMTTPLLYALRAPVSNTIIWKLRTAWIGTGLAWAGAILEAVADAHKFQVKRKSNDKTTFQGPSSGSYALTRHPNYTGEVTFWCGVWLAGLPSFGQSVVAWLCSTVGLYGIVSIMRKASERLENRQAEKYGGQPKYEAWKKDVPAPLIPFIKGQLS
jgi:steroid 5-alpha reductase family enzyme